MPAGRPSKYDPAYCDQVVQLGRAGKSKAQIAAALDVARQTLDQWAEENPEFRNAMAQARELSLAWWEEQGQAGVWGGKQFNANAYRLQVMNRFPDDWRDRQEITGAGGGPVMVAWKDGPADG